jgi:pimeloyl-ACP methyl ester carboxylesterase
VAFTCSLSSGRNFLWSSVPAVAGGLATVGRKGRVFAEQTQTTASPEKGKVWSKQYWAHKGDVKLYMCRKRGGAPQPGKSALPVLFLVHGSSTSSRSFELTVPGRGDYSLMDTFAGYSFDVWTMDFEGYGRSSRTEGNSDIASGVEDLKAAMETVAREMRPERFHFFGQSSGALRAGAFAMIRPAGVTRMVLGAFTHTGQGSPTLARPRQAS